MSSAQERELIRRRLRLECFGIPTKMSSGRFGSVLPSVPLDETDSDTNFRKGLGEGGGGSLG